MSSTPVGCTPQELVGRVRGRTLDCRTGILLLPPEQLGFEASLAARYNTDGLDFVRFKGESLGPNDRFLRLDREVLVGDLEELCQGRSYLGAGDTNCLFVYNFDLALAALEHSERRALWNFLRDRFRKQPKALVFALPGGAFELLPDEPEQRVWQQGQRWAVLETTSSHSASAYGVAEVISEGQL